MKLATSGLVVVQDKKVLLAFSQNKNAWYLPGGKIDKNETPVEALLREIEEELSIRINPEELVYFCHITAPAYGEKENVIMEQECFLYRLKEEIKPQNEITDIKYFSWEKYLQEPEQVPGVLMLFDILQKNNKI